MARLHTACAGVTLIELREDIPTAFETRQGGGRTTPVRLPSHLPEGVLDGLNESGIDGGADG